jgi:predicted membrane-bound spermidine synthase
MGSAFLPAMFFASGAAALIYQVVFSKALTYVFGSMSTATNTVLATYMGGIALGTWLGGLLAPRLRRPVAAYAVCEVLIAIYCAASPWVFDLVRNAYVALAFGQTPDAAGLLPLRVMLGGAGLLVPTMLMGLTLPILVSHFEHHKGAIGVSVGKLYAANTLGAATGALMTGYFVLPALGVHRTTLLAVALNLLVAYFAFRFQRSLPEEQPAGRFAAASAVAAGERSRGWTAIALLTIGGFVTLALEVDYIHLLAVAAGNSTYAFSLMLFAFLLGLGGGSELARRFMGRFDRLQLLAWLEFGLCITIILGASAVDRIPEFFAGFSEMTLGWGVQELIRGAVCCAAMIPPALFIGAIFPIAIDCVGLAFPDHPIRMLGYASALNTLGNILGVLVAGFVLLPTIGPFASVKLLAGVCLLLGACAAIVAHARRLWMAPALAAAAVLLLAPRTLDYDALTTGANVYFAAIPQGHVIARAESLDGGLTTVNERVVNGQRLRTLLTNGKFQGNDAVGGEMVAQVGFALAPLLHTAKRSSALVIGYGTGNTSRVLHDAGFSRLDVVDISADIFRLANEQLTRINDRVSEKPNVRAYVTDGRNFLLLSPNRYDVISLEISSIWFAGAASLYSRDFYRLARQHLSEGGVLQQWMQLHHARPEDIFYVIGSARAEFRCVWLYLIGNQGIIVATDDADAVPSEANIAAIDARRELKEVLRHYGGSGMRVAGNLLLDPAGVDRFLRSTGLDASYFVSDDDNAYLEYSTPKGNAVEGTLEPNIRMLAKYSVAPAMPAADESR